MSLACILVLGVRIQGLGFGVLGFWFRGTFEGGL